MTQVGLVSRSSTALGITLANHNFRKLSVVTDFASKYTKRCEVRTATYSHFLLSPLVHGCCYKVSGVGAWKVEPWHVEICWFCYRLLLVYFALDYVT